MKALYFSWVRERIGKSEEDITPPDSVKTVGDLVNWLRGRGEGYATAFDNEKTIRAALDHVHAKPDAMIGNAHEVAFFPPMTGG
ncbi:molybdopterin converting factor subunit 1 [Beijerinckia indica]|uniref:Molybdopterin converting factor, subunit 1 n=1 Tax=Beijerinckia indica subsp. indica (strain ATCC 9039 / DSM 1715 / NCIMB 8712) TaxID=395963 RepID=B2ICS0_BEII9|nr:molybdopterin converting factor subunit 1 [Beijerinckia indica]ACB95344.1 molybdopterin converting factor, subunit 1 [Beijerinckia indica subsp. indica ATCC 9039]